MKYEPRHDKTNEMSMRPAKTQISLGIRWAHSHFVGFVMSRLIYLHRLNKFGRALFFECNFSERDILRNFKENIFFTDVLLAWSKVKLNMDQ